MESYHIDCVLSFASKISCFLQVKIFKPTYFDILGQTKKDLKDFKTIVLSWSRRPTASLYLPRRPTDPIAILYVLGGRLGPQVQTQCFSNSFHISNIPSSNLKMFEDSKCLIKSLPAKMQAPITMLSFAADVSDFTIGICTRFKSISSFSWQIELSKRRVNSSTSPLLLSYRTLLFPKCCNRLHPSQVSANLFIALDSVPQSSTGQPDLVQSFWVVCASVNPSVSSHLVPEVHCSEHWPADARRQGSKVKHG